MHSWFGRTVETVLSLIHRWWQIMVPPQPAVPDSDGDDSRYEAVDDQDRDDDYRYDPPCDRSCGVCYPNPRTLRAVLDKRLFKDLRDHDRQFEDGDRPKRRQNPRRRRHQRLYRDEY